MKALVHHVPTDEDITDLLKEFTVDFLFKGYASLVAELRYVEMISYFTLEISINVELI